MYEIDKYFKIYKDTPSKDDPEYKCSVHYNSFRLKKAEEQANLKPVEIEKIVGYINHFLELLKMGKVEFPIMNGKNINYQKIKTDNGLQDEGDIVWLKFTTDGYIGVVATSNDINFDVPKSKGEYNEKIKVYNKWDGKEKRLWAHTTSGIIVHHVKKSWDESFVLVFPLKNIPDGLTRHDVERAIGNYLIDNGVPILDFYSHNY